MATKKVASLNSARTDQDRDYTEITIGDDGKIVVEFNIWNDSLRKHIVTALQLIPEEAHLLSKMLVSHAKSANLNTRTATALAIPG